MAPDERSRPLIAIYPSTPSSALLSSKDLGPNGVTTQTTAFLLASPPTNSISFSSNPIRPSPRPRKQNTQSTSSYDYSRPNSSRTTSYSSPLSITTARTSAELDLENESCRSSQSGEFTDLYSMYSSEQPQHPSSSAPVRSNRNSRPSSATSQTAAAKTELLVTGSASRRALSPSGIELPRSRTASPMREDGQPIGYGDDHLHVQSSLSRQPSSSSISNFHRPTTSAQETKDMGNRDAPKKRGNQKLVIVNQSPSPISSPTTATNSSASPMDHQQLPFPSSTPSSSRHLSPPPTPSRPTSASNPGPSRLSLTPLAIPRDKSPSIVSSRARTASAAPSAITQRGVSENGDLEDMDSLYVRSTYARLEATGVPGDGYQDGVERTRARAPGYKERRATLWPSVPTDLLPQEVDFLSSLDRYGFKKSTLTTRQENRLALLPAASLQKGPVTVKTPPSSPPLPRTELKAIPPGQNVSPKEVKRIDKWGRMMRVNRRDPGGNVESWSIDDRKGKKLRERIYKGVPDRWRSAVWWTMIDASRVETKSPPLTLQGSSRKGVGLNAKELATQYREWIDRPSSHDIQIDLDVPRTISGHVMFHTRYGSGQRSLFHVLHSFSLVCDSCGYCQGMGPIAATLLCYLEPDRTYAALVRLHDCYDMHSIFSPGFPGLLESIYVQERLTETLMPDVFTAFKNHMISSTSYATKWYITLFANTFPFQTQLRLWDAFILEGRDAIVVIALAIIWVLREHLASAQATFETILSLLSSFYVAEQEDALLSWISRALGDKKLRASMVKWRVDWGELVKSGKDGTALL
ncbi:hypothetical protein FRB93_007234 [Tulasnella sp. JGI-2019a]|nr:hypothetical protein FRB93_007234 [Tulasnella sp. JGI-2019a]